MSLRKMLLAATAIAILPSFAAHGGEISFSPVPFAADDAAKRAVTASSTVTIDGKEVAIGYHELKNLKLVRGFESNH